MSTPTIDTPTLPDIDVDERFKEIVENEESNDDREPCETQSHPGAPDWVVERCTKFADVKAYTYACEEVGRCYGHPVCNSCFVIGVGLGIFRA